VAAITVTHQSGREYLVRVDDAGTSHRVTVPDDLASHGLPEADDEALIEASFDFMLAREPAGAILGSFSLDVIGRYFPEYPAEMRQRFS